MMKKKRVLIVVFAGLMLLNAADAFAYVLGKVVIHGFVSQGYLKSSDNNYLAQTEDGTFEFNETAINFSIEPAEKFRIALQLMSRDLGETRNNDIYLDWGYADYRFNDIFGIRVGKVQLPMGLYNQTRDVDFVRTNILLPQAVYDETYRDLLGAYQGGAVYGDINFGSFGDIEYEALLGTFVPDKNSPLLTNLFISLDPLGSGSSGTGHYSDMKWGLATALRWNAPINGLRFGVSNFISEVDHGSYYESGIPGMTIKGNLALVVRSMPVLSVEYVWNNLKLAAEYKQFNYDSDLSYNDVTVVSMETHNEMYYGSVSYRFCDWFEMGTYYSVFYYDRNDKDGNLFAAAFGQPNFVGWQKDWTVSARFDLSEYITIKLETHFIDGAANMFQFENPQGLERDSVLYAAKCSFNF
ncbi:MAG: hypothetical protein PHY29_05015 [Syntrophales bacterium]|nr:hypothetical protein [Syntrophales bacterium]